MQKLIFSLVLGISLCAGANKPAAKGTPATPQATAKETKLVVDKAASKVEWFGTKKVTGGHNGTIGIESGEIVMNDKTIQSGKIVIDMNDLKVTDIPATSGDNAKLVNHLKDADFFDVANHPKATLEISGAVPLKDGVHEVSGTLKIKNETQKITFPVTVVKNKDNTTATGSLTFDRTKFGVKYASGNFFKLAADRIINDNVELKFNIVAK